MRVGDLVIDYCDDIGVVVKEVNCGCWKIHYTNGRIIDMWIYDIKGLSCSK